MFQNLVLNFKIKKTHRYEVVLLDDKSIEILIRLLKIFHKNSNLIYDLKIDKLIIFA